MSFILDALRKSESERQQDAAPSIARIPSAVPRHGVPPWAVATMAALGVGVVVLAGAWIFTITRPGPAIDGGVLAADSALPAQRGAGADRILGRDAGAALADAQREEPLPLPPPRSDSPTGTAAGGGTSDLATDFAAGSASPLAAVAETTASASRGARGAAADSPLAAAAQTSPQAQTARPQTNAGRPAADAIQPSSQPVRPSSQSTQPARSTAGLPQVEPAPAPYHSLAQSLGLPDLTLELLAFTPDDPAKQFVFINGARYAVGDTLPGGARVIAINARGAVLLAQGRQLQLEPR